MLFTGFEPWRVFLVDILPASGGGTAWIENQSFNGFLTRLLTDRLELEAFPADNPGALAVSLATYGWAALVVIAAWWVTRRPALRPSNEFALGFALWTAASVLVLPAAWYHYPALFILPLGVALFAFEEEAAGWRWTAPRHTLVLLVLLGGAVLLLAYGSYGIVWRGVNLGGMWKLILSYKFYGMAGAALAIWLMLYLKMTRRNPI